MVAWADMNKMKIGVDLASGPDRTVASIVRYDGNKPVVIAWCDGTKIIYGESILSRVLKDAIMLNVWKEQLKCQTPKT